MPRLSVLLGWHFTVAPTTAVGHWTSVSHRSFSLSCLCTGLLCVYFQHSLWGCVQHTLMLVLFGTSCEPLCPRVHSMSLQRGLFTHKPPLRAHTCVFLLTLQCFLQLPSHFCNLTSAGPSRQKITGLLPLFSVNHVTQQFSLFLFVVSSERKNSENLCSEFSRKNVLLNALCLLTSLSCQFFCSAFVVAKDLCASSFVSDLRCQRCPFDVECRPHMRHHLCSSRGAPFSVLAYVWIAACGCRSLCVFAWGACLHV